MRKFIMALLAIFFCLNLAACNDDPVKRNDYSTESSNNVGYTGNGDGGASQ